MNLLIKNESRKKSFSQIRNQRGASSLEYGLMVALVLVGVLVVVQFMGFESGKAFVKVRGSMDGATSTSGTSTATTGQSNTQ